MLYSVWWLSFLYWSALLKYVATSENQIPLSSTSNLCLPNCICYMSAQDIFLCYNMSSSVLLPIWQALTINQVTINLQTTNEFSCFSSYRDQLLFRISDKQPKSNSPFLLLPISVCPIVFVIWVHRTSPKVAIHPALSYFQCKSPKRQPWTSLSCKWYIILATHIS